MALVIEDGTGILGADSWLTIAEIETTLALLGYTNWTGNDPATSNPWTDAKKEVAARLATIYLDKRYCAKWTGRKTYGRDRQNLQWPRARVWDSSGYLLDSNVVPTEVLESQAILADFALVEQLQPNIDPATGTVLKSDMSKVGPLQVKQEFSGSSGSRKIYQIVDDMLCTFKLSMGVTPLWRA